MRDGERGAELRELDLSWACLDDEDAKALARTRWVVRLKVLNLWHNSIGDGGARALLESPRLEDVELLDLRENLENTGYRSSQAISRETKAALKKRFGKRLLQTPAGGKK